MSPEMRNMFRRKRCLGCAVGANDVGWKGRAGPLHLAGPDPPESGPWEVAWPGLARLSQPAGHPLQG